MTSTADSLDVGTLRTAVEWANISTNANPEVSSPPNGGIFNPNTIEFDTTGVFATAQTITLSASLGPLVLSGTSVTEIVGGGPPLPAPVTISGGGSTQVFSIASGVSASIGGLTIAGGLAGSGGGIDNAGNLILGSCTVTANTATNYGGGIDNSGTMSVYDSNITGNSAVVANGGGVENSGTMVIQNSTIAGNSVLNKNPNGVGNGGGIENEGTMTISFSTVTGNSANGGDGGGIENQSGSLTFMGGTIANNNAGNGGGIDNFSGELTLTNSTIAGNTATGAGAGIDMENGQNGTLTALSSTIAANTASISGGGLFAAGGTSALYDTIVALNTASGSAASNIALSGGSVSATSAYNLIGTGGSGGLTNGTNGNIVGVANPGLGALALNGGATQTMAVLPGSPALGNGSSTITGVTFPVPFSDQRGISRPSGNVDIGAFQDRGFTLTMIAGGSPQSAAANTAFASPLAVEVTSPSGDPVQGGIVYFTPPSSGATASLSATTATIGANGGAEVTAMAGSTGGTYSVTASILGTTSPVAFSLTNHASGTTGSTAIISGVGVIWGTQTAALVLPAAAGGLLLPAGRATDLPWLGIQVFQITLSQSETLTTSDFTFTSARGIRYRAAGLSGSGTNYTIFLSRPIKTSDRVTIKIAGTGLTTFTGRLNVLPGDFNDDGVVNKRDVLDVRAKARGLGPASSIFADINGNGVVNNTDVKLVRQRVGSKLPRQTATTRVRVLEARPRIALAHMVLARHGDLPLRNRLPRG